MPAFAAWAAKTGRDSSEETARLPKWRSATSFATDETRIEHGRVHRGTAEVPDRVSMPTPNFHFAGKEDFRNRARVQRKKTERNMVERKMKCKERNCGRTVSIAYFFFSLGAFAAWRDYALTRYEFEGSLIGLLVQGTCTVPVVQNENEARTIVPRLISDAGCNSAILKVYRMDDPDWSRFTSSATITATYCVYNADNPLWWLLSIADFY
jgi:hypothetical protein